MSGHGKQDLLDGASAEFDLTHNLWFESPSQGEKPAIYDAAVAEFAQSLLIEEDRGRFLAQMDRTRLLKKFDQGRDRFVQTYHITDGAGGVFPYELTVRLREIPQSDSIIGFCALEPAGAIREHRDHLTGLYDRIGIARAGMEALFNSTAARDWAFCIRIDEYWAYYQRYGLPEAHVLMYSMVKAIQAGAGEGEVLGRVGWGEFLLILPAVTHEDQILERIAVLHANVRELALRQPMTVCIGAAKTAQKRIYRLWNHASAALAQARVQGRGSSLVYNRDALVYDSPWRDQQWLIDELDEIVCVSDPATRELYYVNKRGRKEDPEVIQNLIHPKCYEVIFGRTEVCAECKSVQLSSDRLTTWEQTDPYLQRHFLHKGRLIPWKGKMARLELAIDITNKENDRRQLGKRLESEQILVDCIHHLAAADSLDRGFARVLEIIAGFYKADRAFVFEKTCAKTGLWKSTYEWAASDKRPLTTVFAQEPLYISPQWQQTLREHQPVVIESAEDVRDYPQEYEILFRVGVGYIVGLPLFQEQQLVGFLGVEGAKTNVNNLTLLDSLGYFVIHEITERRMRERLEFLSYYDELTGLGNRNRYNADVESLLNGPPGPVGVCAADINGLKETNRLYGHEKGDEHIRQAAKLLRSCFAQRGIYRVNGDEFIVIWKNVDQDTFFRQAEALRAKSKALDGGRLAVGYTWSGRSDELRAMLDHAEERMAIDKEAHYRSRGNMTGQRKVQLAELQRSLEKGEYVIYLQPKVDLKNGRMVSAEALTRMSHPLWGLQGPDRFIPALEKARLIRYLDFYVFEQVCAMIKRWKRQGRPLLTVSVNFSRITLLENDMEHMLDDICGRHQVPKEYLEIEITESIGDIERDTLAEIGSRLRAHGYKLSLDDFGAKYTNLSMLTVMPFDVLKLDKSLVHNLIDNSESRTVAQWVIALCRQLGVACVAEGVETLQQARLLDEMGCDQAQGFYFGKPMPIDAFEMLQDDMA